MGRAFRRPRRHGRRQLNAGIGCLVLFLLPFAAVGGFSAVQAVRAAVIGDYGQAGFLTIFALTFGGVGVGGIVAALKGRKKAAELDALKARHPAAPWLWRADWAAGRIEDAGRGTMWFAWTFAVFWNLVSAPAAYFGAGEAMAKGDHAALLALLFPAVGVGLLAWAVRATIRFRRFGSSRLELATTPAAIGRSLLGTVHAPAAVLSGEGFRLVLTCLRRITTGSGKSRSTREEILWQEEQRVPGRPARTAVGMATTVPVAFALPPDARPCDDSNPRDQLLWRLAVSAEVPGVDYESTFEVPVFRTAESERPRTAEEEAAARSLAVPDHYQPPPDTRIRVSRNRRGTEVVFPVGRNRGAAVGLTMFLALWLGVIWAMVRLGAPILFPLVFGAFALLLLWIALDQWLWVSRVTAGDGAVTVATGLLAPTRERRLAAAEIAEVTTRIGMQAGGTPYYDVVVVRRDGRRVVAGRGIRDKREAEWVAGAIREGVGG